MRIKLFTTEQGRKNQNHAAERDWIPGEALETPYDEEECAEATLGFWIDLRSRVAIADGM